ncbi:MAG: AAA family ATPase [Pseudanabaena sp. M135S2SP2A07QC]|nr:AAA family ATPase [Pseudanabaena sp. M090S1SP2A07QC]MCA6505206.1 AAA family ATPase [Pseudanabaena sp. M172S2SP2A07QC]MCA6520952.1 AAA family ATPase [Pseudanabaena sp. M051S1SP2A07QC]MCA6526092.1 AAA family ATPase [Pseudanabaena sp. M179S2SP2A07QC]MCA6529289.1 AAA family ATPase [Pseudanabaena sp. M125S2SP2A07QC]MCA6533643.1 AAA family ATPase [Pseudanabaena sp. M176S2SP2A07QC]MCA6538286.1 AAA family ATPase [Pseudanabaena sp. M037S2SP2A07QC]MCA6544151.1 AAA family ATPase [Pseudanabaena sp. M
MKLKRVSIKGLNNKVDCDFEFHDDINIVTGINGCGKTTFLKILWYAISGNIERLISEISFESFNLETSCFNLSLSSKDTVFEWKYNGNEIQKNGLIHLDSYSSALEIAPLQSLIIESNTSSLFFPTFRRIEGGYLMANVQTSGRIAKPLQSLSPPFRSAFPLTVSILQSERNSDKVSIKSEFDKLSKSLSIAAHKFICSISTYDLGLLLVSRYAHASEKTNEEFLRFSTLMSNQIEGIKSDIQSDQQEALTILTKLQQANNAVNSKRDELLKPFKILSELVIKVLRYKGIKLDDFVIGESTDAIDSRLLSAGEQQMLSFLCYNAFYENSVIFIDEPELSLHVDWQRRLFPNLMKQQSSNQFIVATHSPCIYSKYPDKEIILSEEKGE